MNTASIIVMIVLIVCVAAALAFVLLRPKKNPCAGCPSCSFCNGTCEKKK